MEKEQELTKLVNVLRQTARVSVQPDWSDNEQDAARYCVVQYNRILKRLEALDPTVSNIFDPLPDESSLQIAAIACRQLAAYYSDEVEEATDWQDNGGPAFDPKAFRDFWRKGALDIQDLGEAVRESIQTWSQQRKRHGKSCQKSADSSES